MTGDADESDRSYLVTVEYDSDAERKRAEYLLDNWEEGSSESLRALARRMRGVDIEEVYDQLVTKVPPERVHAFELTPVETRAESSEETVEVTIDSDPERAEWAMESLLNKRKAVAEDVDNNEYAVYTKKGRARIRYTVESTPGGDARLWIRIEGYGDAPMFLKEFFEDELSYMLT